MKWKKYTHPQIPFNTKSWGIGFFFFSSINLTLTLSSTRVFLLIMLTISSSGRLNSSTFKEDFDFRSFARSSGLMGLIHVWQSVVCPYQIWSTIPTRLLLYQGDVPTLVGFYVIELLVFSHFSVLHLICLHTWTLITHVFLRDSLFVLSSIKENVCLLLLMSFLLCQYNRSPLCSVHTSKGKRDYSFEVRPS